MPMTSPHIYLDSCCFIDVVKEKVGALPTERTNDVWFVKKILEAHRAGHLIAHTSMIAVGECLAVEEGKQPSEEVKEMYRSLLTSGQYVRLLNPTPKTARLMQEFRWTHDLSLRSVDAMHLASALEVGCLEFVTTDVRLKKPKFLAANPVMGTLGLRLITAPKTATLPTSYTQGIINATE
jgi:predicted nucleic acid-binding protein